MAAVKPKHEDGDISNTDEALSFCIVLLQQECEADQYNVTLSTLMKIFKNVQKNPLETKYREFKVDNKAIADKVWKYSGAQQFLVATGWTQVEDRVILLEEKYVGIAIEVLQRSMRFMFVPAEGASGTHERVNGACGTTVNHTPKSENEQKLEEIRKKQYEQMKREKDEKKRISEMIKADRKNIGAREMKDSVARPRQFGSKIQRFEDIGVDLNKGGGG